MVKMYSTARRPAERTCVAQRGTFMLMILVFVALFSMRYFFTASLKHLQGSSTNNVIRKSNTGSSDISSSSNPLAEEDEEGQDDSSSLSILSKFPSFEQGGGVVVFYHTSRTGGLTIRQNFSNRHETDGIKYIKLGHSTKALEITDKIIRHILERKTSTNTIARTRTTNSNALPMVNNQNDDANSDAAATNETDTDATNDADDVDGDADGVDADVVVEAPRPETFVLEIPGELSTLMQVSQLVDQWRILATEHKTSFFAFTLIRDPVPFHVSFFNTYNVPLLEPTVENLLESMPHNEQCHRIVQNNNNDIVALEDEEGQESSSSKSSTQCEQAYDWMRTSLDWIGTTEKLNQDTLPILAHLLLQDASIGQSMPRYFAPADNNNNNNLLRVDYLSEEDEARIRELSDMDQKLYEDVLQDFSFAMDSSSSNNMQGEDSSINMQEEQNDMQEEQNNDNGDSY